MSRTGKWQEGSIFFFEKKKQKAFLPWSRLAQPHVTRHESFFASFFSKKEDSSCRLPCSSGQ
jgi:hypothetical protein